MIRAQITLAVVGLFLLPMQPAHAESQYWLSVASYRNQSVAEEAAARAREGAVVGQQFADDEAAALLTR